MLLILHDLMFLTAQLLHIQVFWDVRPFQFLNNTTNQGGLTSWKTQALKLLICCGEDTSSPCALLLTTVPLI